MSDPRMLWWVDRSAGLVSLVLLTLVMTLGIVAVGRPRAATTGRAVAQGLHRQLPLVAVVLLGVHITTAVADAYVPLGWADLVLPFRAAYRPIWIGLGTLAFDLLVVLVVTSLLRTRLGHRTWRAVHFAAYGLWPLAVVHALGSGSDMHAQAVHVIGLSCVALVVLATGWRLVSGPAPAGLRMAGLAAVLALTAVVASWAAQGPLAHGWAKRAALPVTAMLR